MKICMLIKYPPIQGGVSTQSYWFAHNMARRGHTVHVVTHAMEVEESSRFFMTAEDMSRLEQEYPESGGAVHLHLSEPMSQRLYHIPRNNPIVSKLAGLAADVVTREDCDLVYGYYFEPFAVAAQLAASWTGRPLVLQHAGSDIDRLMKQPDLAVTYRHVLRSADRIVTRGHLVPRFLSMGIPVSRLSLSMLNNHGDVFDDAVEPLPFNELVQEMTDAGLRLSNTRPFDSTLPVIGIYGKSGVAKGTYDLIAALGRLKRAGHAFQFVMLTAVNDEIRDALAREGMTENTWIFPFIPNWRVARFIRACSAVCFLERDFPVTIHGPVVPREVLACGVPLILSGEIYRKQFYRHLLADGDNFYLVDDPKEIANLAATLEAVITKPDEAAAIGARGRAVWEEIDRGRDAAEGYEQMFQRVLDGEPESEELSALTVRSLFPYLSHALQNDDEIAFFQAADESLRGKNDLLREAMAWVESLEFQDDSLKWARSADLAGLELLLQEGPRFTQSDVLAKRLHSLEDIEALVPVVHPFVHVMPVSTEQSQSVLPEHKTAPQHLLMFREANYNVRSIAVNQLVIEVLNRCTGNLTVAEIAGHLGVTTEAHRQMLLQTFQHLRNYRLVIFQPARTVAEAEPVPSRQS